MFHFQSSPRCLDASSLEAFYSFPPSATRRLPTFPRARSLAQPLPTSPSAFTLIELVVCIVLLAVLAGAVAPRFLSLGSRRAESEVQAVATLISAAATRDELTSQPIALTFDAQSSRLSMLSVQAASADVAGVWKQDPILAPVSLSDATIVSIQSGVRTLDPRDWRVEFPQIEPREKLTLELADSKNESHWVLILNPTATAAALYPGTEKDLPSDETDLDQVGKEEDTW